MSYYLGYINADIPSIVGNINSVMNLSRYNLTTNEQFVFSITTDDANTLTTLQGCISTTQEGDFTVTAPNLEWQVDEKIRLMSFKIQAISESGSITFISPNLIFFATNPDVVDSLTGDITTALESIDNQSFFAAWFRAIIK